MNEESRKIIRQYKTQIIVLLFALTSLLISLLIIVDLIKIEKGQTTYKRAKITKRGQLASSLVLISALYFVYAAYEAYMKQKNKTNFVFLIAALLVLIAAGMRFITISKNAEIEGAEDIIL